MYIAVVPMLKAIKRMLEPDKGQETPQDKVSCAISILDELVIGLEQNFQKKPITTSFTAIGETALDEDLDPEALAAKEDLT